MSPLSALHARPGLKLVLALYFFFAIGYSLLVPMWEAPDETAHYLYVLILAREKRLPTDLETYEALQPPGYYWPAAQLFRLLEAIDPALIRPYRPPLSPVGEPTRYDWQPENYRPLWGGRILRWLNSLVGIFTLLFIHRGARRLFPDSVIPLAAVTLVGLTPQFLHISASGSNDPLANLAGAFLFWLVTIAAIQRLSWRKTALVLAAALFLPFVIKLTILPLSITVFLALLWQTRSRWHRYWRWLIVAAGLLTLLLPAGLSFIVLDSNILIWRTIWLRLFYIRPDFFSRDLLWWMFETFAQGYWGRLSFNFVGLPIILTLWLTGLAGMGGIASLRILLAGKIGGRWLAVGLLAAVTVILGTLWLAGRTNEWWQMPAPAFMAVFALLFLTWLRLRQIDPADLLPVHKPLWALLWTAAVLTLLMVFKNTLATPQYQGRFLFPALGPVTILIIAGWYTLLPRRTADFLPHLLLIFLVFLNLYLWFDKVIPIYYEPFLDM